jgi:hypothetical protein
VRPPTGARGGLPHTQPLVTQIQLVKFQLHARPGQWRQAFGTRRRVTGSAARDRPQTMQCCQDTRRLQTGATTASLPNRRGAGKPDPSRGDVRDTPAAGREDPHVPQEFVGGGGGLPEDRGAGPRRAKSVSSRRVGDRRTNKCRTARGTLGRCAREMPTPRGRSAERASSITGRGFRQNEQ